MCPYTLPIGCVYSHSLKCGFTKDGLSRTFPRGRVADQQNSVELPLTLRGHSLGQSKDQVERISQHHLNMFLDVIDNFQYYLAFVE